MFVIRSDNRNDDRSNDRQKRARQRKTMLVRKKAIKELRIRRFKLALIVLTIFSCFVYLGYEILNIKLAHGQEYESKAITQLVNSSIASEQVIKPVRGSIVDKNLVNLAVSKPVYEVFLDVRVLVYADKDVQQDTLKKINQVFDISMETLNSYLEIESTELDENGKVKKLIPVNDTNHLVIAKDVSYEKAMEMEGLNAKDVYLDADSKRSYIYDNLAAHVIGFVRGDVSFGLEKQYNKYLSGTPGRVFRVYSNEGSVVTEKIPPKNGDTLVTTIDIGIQQFAEEIVKKYGEAEQAENTSVIVMNPKTGGILAMAEYPSFNLNDPTALSGITKTSYKEEWKDLDEREYFSKLDRLWTNYNITDTFEPGSTFKPVTVAAALEENIISPANTYFCSGSKEVIPGEPPINCHLKTGHGMQTLEEALANSCNVAMMHIADEMGRDIFYKYQRDFGFGEQTGIDLPSEIGAGSLLHTLSNLNASELATSSFGQRFNATPLQVISAFSAVINGGNLMKPHVVSQILDEKGNLVVDIPPVMQKKVISQETSKYLRMAMESVIKNGTGKRAAIPGWAIGGKTGTGEQGIKDTPDYHYTLSIITYFPVENPEYVAMTIINRPKEYIDGVTSPSPMMQELMDNIIRYKSIPPSYDEDGNISQSNNMNKSVVGDYLGKTLDEVTKNLNQLSLEYELIGSGGAIVKSQFPEPGTKVDKGTTVILHIEYGDGGYEMTTIPDLQGMTRKDAEAMLNAMKLVPIIQTDGLETPDETEDEDEDNAPDGDEVVPEDDGSDYIVYEQTPVQTGIEVIENTQIKIKVKSKTNGQ